ncbi:hypothetical protein [Streptomyces sp. NPDC002580]|uniref:hypothetical protein n=1 Tax=Streptomyces sp. NPDC002580 TaxID=3364653 RepID=UPI0036A7929A
MPSIRAPWAHDVFQGAATGVLPGGLVLGAPLLGAVVGMPGAAVRYVLLTAALSCVLGTVVTRALFRRRPVTPRTAARCALTACLLGAGAGLWPSVPVFCGAVLGGALLGSPGLRLFRATPAWCAGALTGLAAAGALSGALAERPGTALALCGIAGAALLTPSATFHRADAFGRTDPFRRSDANRRDMSGSWSDTSPEPDTGPVSGSDSNPGTAPRTGTDPEPDTGPGTGTVPRPHADEGGRGRRPGAGTSRSARVDAAVLGAGAAAAFFAAQDLLVFRRLLLGGDPAALTAVAAAAAVVPVLAVAPLLRAGRPGPPGCSGHTGRSDPGARQARRPLPLLLLAVAAATTALAASADTPQLVISLALALGCSAVGLTALGFAGLRVSALPALLGGLAGIGALALAGRLLSAGDALVLASVVPLSRAALLLRAARPGSGTRTVPGAGDENEAGNEVLAALDVTGLTVRHRNRPRVTRLRLTVAPGELVVLHDQLPGRRAGAALRALGGVRGPSHGRYRILGHDLTRADAPTRWRLGVCALLDPQDGTSRHLLPQLASAISVSAALRTAVAALDPARADEVCRAVRTAFPVLDARGEDPPAALEPAERCVLGLALALVARPRLLLLDLTGSGVPHLVSDPDIADLLRRVTSQGTAVLVAAARPEPALGGRAVGLPTGRRAPRTRPLPRVRKAST